MNQTKLTRQEWNAVEIPVSAEEQHVLKFIQAAYHDTTLITNKLNTLYTHLKLTPSPALDVHLYHKFFGDVPWKVPSLKVKLKSADKIRLDSCATLSKRTTLFETIVIYLCSTKQYFHLNWMLSLHVRHPNPFILDYAKHVLSECKCTMQEFTMDAVALLEKNPYVIHNDIQLYRHQRELFNMCKDPSPKLILYIAPTGTGKTMSPLALACQYRVIFVCAAKHVGMALIKACVSVGKPCAIGFGCESPSDVKLHNSAAVKATRDRKSGAIRKIDNEFGEKVEILVCDLQSFRYAQAYMYTFFPMESVLTYWDEPTIAMDEHEHPLHEIIRENWACCSTPIVVLSSATLPNVDYTTITDRPVHRIYSYESSKTIQLVTPDNYIVLPHHYCSTPDELMACIAHLEEHLILLKYVDLGEILAFMHDVPVPFCNIEDITIMNIKRWYLQHLKTIPFTSTHVKTQVPPSINLCSNDAWTCAHGPTMFVVDNVDNIVSYYLKSASIPSYVMNDLLHNLEFNNAIASQIAKLDKSIEDSNKDGEKEKKMADNRVSPEIKRLQQLIVKLQSDIRPIALPSQYIPNTLAHLERFQKEAHLGTSFTCDIDVKTLEKVLGLEIESTWKVLLMMGIAVFSMAVTPAYLEIVKDLTADQKMFAVFATKDFIFGTNYQFANLYLGKDLLSTITQEKIIQTFGRVGRGKQVPYSIRLRDTAYVQKLFLPQDNIEGDILLRLFRK
jgi:hypothetical protein